MASADRKHLIAACVAAVDLRQSISPNARLWLARASLHADPKGRTGYGSARYSKDTADTQSSGDKAIDELMRAGIVAADHTEDGVECWRLCHYEWESESSQIITGYGRDAGQQRDGLPPQYGRSVDDAIEPASGNQDFVPPKWSEIAEQVKGGGVDW